MISILLIIFGLSILSHNYLASVGTFLMNFIIDPRIMMKNFVKYY